MSEITTTLPDRQPTLRVAAMPSDANYTGDIFGGWLMGQVDIAGSIPAVHRAKGRVVTVAVNSGRTSITVDVEVYAQRDPANPVCVKVTEATLTYVAVTEDRKPRALPAE